MSFQPLNPEQVNNIDPFNTASLTGVDARTGLYLDVDPDNSSVLLQTNNTTAMYIDKFQNMGINTISPSAQLDINSSSGSCIQLTYNGSSVNKANMGVTSDGKLVLMAGGSEVNVDISSNFNVKSHNGGNSGLMLGNTLVMSTADQLNFNVVTPGTAAVSKAVVLNSSGSVSGINVLSATTLAGIIETANQPNIRSLDIVDIAGHTGSTGLSLGGVLVSSTAAQLNYTNVSPGIAAQSKAIVLNADRNISNINALTASELTGQLQTAAQPMITSLGTLTGLNLSGDLTGLTDLSINTTETGRTLVLNDASGNCIRMYYNAASSVANFTDLLVDGSGNLKVTASGGNVDITTHDGTRGLSLNGVLVKASSDQLNYLHGSVPGNVSDGKAMVADSNRNIGNLNTVYATSLEGTLLTAAQPNIASVNALNIATHDGTALGLKLNGVLVKATADELNYVDTVPGVADARKALVLNDDKDIAGIHSLSADELTGTLTTAAQPAITSVGTLTSLAVAGAVTVGSTTLSEAEVAVIDGITAGTATEGKALIVDGSKDIAGINKLTALQVDGTLLTAAQPNIESVTTLNITGADGELAGLRLGGVLVQATADELNYVNVVEQGIAQVSKALVLNADKSISNINTLSAVSLEGALTTAAQPAITSVGTLTSLAVAGDVTVGTTAISEAEIKVLDGVEQGIVSASKALVVDSEKNISTINSLTANSLIANELTGTIQTGYQPKITSVDTLNIAGINGAPGLSLNGVPLTATAEQINSIFGAGGVGTFENLTVNDSLILANADGTAKGLVLGTTLVGASGEELNYLDGSLKGTVVADKAVVVDNNKDIVGFRKLSADELTGQIRTAAQPIITSVGTLTSLAVAGDLTVGDKTISSAEIGVLDAVVPGTAEASKAVVLDANKAITGIGSIATSALTLVPSSFEYFKTLKNGNGAVNPLPDYPANMRAYSPSLNMVLTCYTGSAKNSDISYMNTYDGFSGKVRLSSSENLYIFGMVWSPMISKFVIVASPSNSAISQSEVFAWTSSNGTTWVREQQRIRYGIGPGTSLEYHEGSGHVVFFSSDKFYYSADAATWGEVTLTSGSISSNQPILSGSTTIIKSYVLAGKGLASGSAFPIVKWDGSSWSEEAVGLPTSKSMPIRAYHEGEDRLYMFPNHPISTASGIFTVYYIDNVSTTAPSSWGAVQNTQTSNVANLSGVNAYAHNKYGVIVVGVRDTAGDTQSQSTIRILRIVDRALVFDFSDGGANSTLKYSMQFSQMQAIVVNGDIMVIPSTKSTVSGVTGAVVPSVYSIPSGLSNGIVFGSTTITEDELAVVDSVVAGTAAAGKALVLNSSKNIAGINTLSATTLTGALSTAAQPAITSVGTLSSLSIANGGALSLGTTSISQAEIGVLDGVEAGVVAASKAVVVNGTKDITGFNKLTAVELTGTLQTAAQPKVTSVNVLDIVGHDATATTGLRLAGELVTSTAAELNYIDGSVPGTVVAGRAVVVNGDKDISSFRNLTAVNLESTAGSLKMGGTIIDETEIAVIDAVAPGVATAGKALVINGDSNISGINTLSTASIVSTAGSLKMGDTIIDEAEIGVLDAVAPGVAAASKALVVNDSVSISGINELSATSVVSTAGSLKMGDTIINEAEIAVLDAVVKGVVADDKAVVVDSNRDVAGFNKLTAVELFGEIQTIAQPKITTVGKLTSLAVTGNVATDSDVVIAGTTVTGTQAGWLAGATPGAALPTTALVVDGEKDISGIRTLTSTNLVADKVTGTIQTPAQPLINSVNVLDIAEHDGATKGLSLGGVLLKPTAAQLNSIFDIDGEGSFANLNVSDTLTLTGADGTSKGLVLGNTLVTSTADELNYTNTTPGHAEANKALVFDGEVSIDSINELKAAKLTGTIQTAAQPLISSVNVLDVTQHDGTTQGLRLGGVLLTATATQINAIFGEGAEGTFNNLDVNDTLTLKNANGIDMGLKLGETLVKASGVELNYLDGSTPGTATDGNALVVDGTRSIAGINSLSATNLTGELQTPAQPKITSVGTLTSLSVAGTVTVGETTLSETEVAVLDGVEPGVVAASKAVVVNADKDISSFRNLTAVSLFSTEVTGEVQTAAQPKITSVGTLTSLDVQGDVNVGGNLNVGGTFISEAEILALDEATPGTASAGKAMITHGTTNSISGINALSAQTLSGTILTTAQPNIVSVGTLTSLDVDGDVRVGGNLNVGGTFISEAEIIALDAAVPGHASAEKAMITDENNSIDSINVLSANSLVGTIDTAAQPNISSVNVLNIANHDGTAVGLSLGGTLVKATATELNYVDTTVGQAQESKALVLNETKDIAGINKVGMSELTTQTGIVESVVDSTSTTTGALKVAGGVGIAKSVNVGGDAIVSGALVVMNTVSLVGGVNISIDEETTSPVTGSLTTAGGVGIAKSLQVGGDATVVGNVAVTGSSSQAGISVITNATESTAPTNGSIVTNGGVGIAKSLNVGLNAAVAGTLQVTGASSLTGDLSMLSITDSTSASTGSLVTAGGVGVAKSVTVGENVQVNGALSVTGATTQTGAVSITNITDSSSTSTGSLVTAGGVGVARNLNVGGLAKISDATASTDAATGALVVAGGAGVGGSLNVGGSVHVDGNVAMDGSMIIEGGIESSSITLTPAVESASLFEISAESEYVLSKTGTGYQWNAGSSEANAGSQLMELDASELTVHVVESNTNTTDSTSASTGALKVAGGVGIAKNLNVGANTALTGTLAVTGASTMTGTVSVANTTDSASVSTGAVVVDGGVGVAKSIRVGENAYVSGNVEITGMSALTGSVSVASVAESSSASTGSLVTAGGVGIAKNLNVGANTALAGTLAVTGASSLVGDVSVVSETESTSVSTGAVVVAGGVGIAKSLNVGVDAKVGGDLDVVGATSHTGAVEISNETESTDSTTGSLKTAGGVGIAKNLNVAGTANIANATPSTSALTGALVVAGGVGVSSDINVGGDVGIAGDINLIGDFNLSGKFNTTNVSLVPDASSPFSTLPLTTITKTDSVLALNKDVGIGYINSAAAVVAVPSLLTTNSMIYYASNSSSNWSTLVLKGAALSTYNSTYSGYAVRAGQLYVNSFTGKIWLAGALYTSSASVAVVFVGDIDNGMDTLYVVGSASSTSNAVECKRIAVATDDNNVVVIRTDGATSELHKMNIASSPTFALVATDAFVSVAWLNGLGKFVATRSQTSSIYCSSDASASSWADATTPTGVAPNTVVFNTTFNLAVAVGPNFIWRSTNGLTWVEATYQALAGNNEFSAVMNSPVSGLVAIYSNVNNSVAQLYYSLDGINWTVITLGGPTFGYDVALPSTVAFSPSNYAYALSNIANVDTVQKIGPITSASMIYGVGITSGYLKSESAIGYEWYNNSSNTETGTELMELTTDGLVVQPIVDVENTTNSTSPSTGSVVTAGGVGIAKNLNVGMDVSIGGAITIEGAFNQEGKLNVSDNTDSVSPSTGSITTAGGVGIAKALNVGTTASVDGSLTIGGASSLTGAVSILSTTETLSDATGSLVTAGGVGIGKSLTVGLDAQINGNATVNGSTTQLGLLSVQNATNSTSASTGSITTSGGVGIAKDLTVGTNANVNGAFGVVGLSSFQGVVSVVNVADSESVSTGALKVSGGVGVTKSLFVGNNVSVAGSLGVVGATSLTGDVSLSSITDSVSPSTGSFVTAGGVGIAKNLNVGVDAVIGGDLTLTGTQTVVDATDALSTTTGSITTAGGVGIAKSLHVGTGIYGTIQTAAQPNISSVSVLNITGADGENAGLSLAGSLVKANATELNYLKGSTPGTATAGNALVLNNSSNIVGINALTAVELTGQIQTPAQPLITSVSTLDITAHDAVEAGLRLSGVLVKATANQINSLFDGSSSPTFVNATVSGNLTLSGANGENTGLILGNTLVTSSGTQLNYVDTTPGTAEQSKALVLNSDLDISGINSLSATKLTGTLETAYQPNLTSVVTLNITGHNGSSTGLSLNGVLVKATADELNYLDVANIGAAEASKALVLNADKNISGINELTAVKLTGQIQTPAQPLITSVGTLESVAIAGDITIGSTIISEDDLLKIDDITNGTAAADKALVLNSDKNISGINDLRSSTIAIGSPVGSDMPLEVGTKPYMFNGSYAYNNDQNAHGFVEAGMGTMGNYSARFAGKVLVTGEVQVTSDRRLKTNVTEISLDMAKRFVKESQPIRFNWKSGDATPELGWLAQSVYKLGGGLEELVTITPHPGMEEEIDEDGFVNPADAKFTLATGKVIPLLTMTTKDLYEQNQAKDAKIADLEARLAKLEQMFAQMQ